MPSWGGTEIVRSPAQALAQQWINCFGQSRQRFRFVKVFSELLESYTMVELEKIIDVLHDRHKGRQIIVTSPAFIEHIADRILKGRFLEGKRLEII